jgi:hypothetical protein
VAGLHLEVSPVCAMKLPKIAKHEFKEFNELRGTYLEAFCR